MYLQFDLWTCIHQTLQEYESYVVEIQFLPLFLFIQWSDFSSLLSGQLIMFYRTAHEIISTSESSFLPPGKLTCPCDIRDCFEVVSNSYILISRLCKGKAWVAHRYQYYPGIVEINGLESTIYYQGIRCLCLHALITSQSRSKYPAHKSGVQ